MLRLFDSHAHYDDKRFEKEFEGGTHGAIKAAHDQGVCGIINVGANLASSAGSVSLAEKYDFIWAAVGIHPSDSQEIGIDEMDEALRCLRELAARSKVVAIGEIGFDYHYDDTDRSCQAKYFDAQLTLAEEVGLSVIIHSRDAMGDTLEMISRHPAARGVMHSFSGSAEVARQLCDKGWYVSFSGPVTYKNANKVKEAAAIVPENRLLIETDCPYLPPVPHRGELNYSGYMHYTCEVVAAIRGASPEYIAEATLQNACRLFRIEEL